MIAAIFLPHQRQRHTAATQLGTDMPRPLAATQIAGPQALTACAPALASSSSSATGLVMPITAARRMCFPIVVGPIPTEWEIARSLAAQAYFRPRTSRSFHIDNRRASGLPLHLGRTGPRPLRPPTAPLTGGALNRIGCRFLTKSVAALSRFPHRPSAWPHARLPKSAPHHAAHI
jgi:hypothetical protein